MKKLLLGILTMCCIGVYAAEENGNIELPSHNLKNTVTLKKALEKRRTTRTFASRALSELEISNLLWAAYGDNRPNGKRTVPAAMGIYAVELYVALPEGAYWHNRGENVLKKICSQDLRAFSDSRKMGAKAPLVIIMVVDKDALGERNSHYAAVEAGAIMQNIYLYCAAYNFNTVVCGSFNSAELAKALKLPANKRVFLTQVVGCGN